MSIDEELKKLNRDRIESISALVLVLLFGISIPFTVGVSDIDTCTHQEIINQMWLSLALLPVCAALFILELRSCYREYLYEVSPADGKIVRNLKKLYPALSHIVVFAWSFMFVWHLVRSIWLYSVA